MNYEQIIVVVLAVCGVLKWVFGIGALFGIAFAGKWFHNFRNRVDDNSDTCESINSEGGLRDRIESLEDKMEVMMEALKKENIINVETKVDASKTEFHDKVDSVHTGSGDIK